MIDFHSPRVSGRYVGADVQHEQGRVRVSIYVEREGQTKPLVLELSVPAYLDLKHVLLREEPSYEVMRERRRIRQRKKGQAA